MALLDGLLQAGQSNPTINRGVQGLKRSSQEAWSGGMTSAFSGEGVSSSRTGSGAEVEGEGMPACL